MRTKRLILLSILLCSLGTTLFLMGCSKDSDTPTGSGPPVGSNSANVPPTGGTVSYETASVTIPNGALPDSTEITVGIPANAPTYSQPTNSAQVGSTFQCECNPAVATFGEDVTITMTYTDGQIGSNNESTLKIMSYENQGEAPVVLGNVTVNAATNTVTGTTRHFSYFVLIVSTGGGGGPSVIPPNPEGGNPQGNWTFANLSVDTVANQQYRMSMTGSGSGSLEIEATNWESNLTLTTHTRTEIFQAGQWIFVTQWDSTWTEHIWGTYIIQQDTLLVTTITGSDTNPEYIGDVRTDGFTATEDWMVMYQKTSSSLPYYNMFLVYTK
jgi:hypothetical protein